MDDNQIIDLYWKRSESAISETDNDLALSEILNHFLSSLSLERCNIFIRRYWYLNSVKEIARDYEISESKVKMSLLRSRNELKLTSIL